jgi:hypothetical protein
MNQTTERSKIRLPANLKEAARQFMSLPKTTQHRIWRLLREEYISNHPGKPMNVSMKIDGKITDDLLYDNYCKENVDTVPGDAETTEFKRHARLHQSLWRQNQGLEIGMQPMRPKPGQICRPLGSRIDLNVARQKLANFLNEDIRRAVHDRLANHQVHQTLDEDRLYSDLLSSMPMCFNLFGVLQNDMELANRAVQAWWPDVPGRVCAVHFEWSPGRGMPGKYLENRSAFDIAFELEIENGGHGILGVETKYHEHCKQEKKPSDVRLKRYAEVAGRSGIFSPSYMEAIVGTDLQQIWLDHLLALSMLQHQSKKWTWAAFVLVHPARNLSYARATKRYRSHLSDQSSFRVSTIESLLAAKVLPEAVSSAFSERYLW